MNDLAKFGALMGSALICAVALALGEMEFAYGAASLFGAVVGFPLIGRGIQKLLKP